MARTTVTQTPVTPPTPIDPGVTNPSDPGGWLLSGNIKNLYKQYGFQNNNDLQHEMAKRLSAGMWPRLAQEVSYGNSLEPLRQNAMSQMLTALNPANVQATIDAFGRKANASGVENSRLANLMMRGNGTGSGAIEGAQLNALNGAQSATNSYLASLLSPEGLQKSIGSYLTALNQGQQSSTIPSFMSLVGGTPQQQQQSGGDGWGQLLGIAASVIPFL